MKMAGNRLCLGAVALLTIAGVALIAPSVASAHQNASGADCSGIYGNAWIFDDFDTNTMTIYLDGSVAYTAADFGGGHEHRIDVPQDGQEHQWQVVIDSSNDTWDSTVSGTVGPCGETTTTIEPPTLATQYDCMSDGPAAGTLSPSSGNWTATGDLDPSKLGVRIDVTAATGYTFSGGQTVSLTATASEDDGCEAAPAQPALDGPSRVRRRRHLHDPRDAPASSISSTARRRRRAPTTCRPARPSRSRRRLRPATG